MVVMRKEKLVDTIIDVGVELKIIKKPVNIKLIKNNVKIIIGDVAFIERLYNIIFIRAKKCNILHTKRIKHLLMELERIRIDLE